jgi:hypothetical protein
VDVDEYGLAGSYRLFRLNSDETEDPIGPPISIVAHSILTIPNIAVEEGDAKFLIFRPQ